MEKHLRYFFSKTLIFILGLCVISMTGLAVLQVVLRYIFNSSLIWIEELSVMLMLWITWLGTILLWLTQSHIQVDMLTKQFSISIQKTLASIIDVLVIVAGCALLFVSLGTLSTLTGLELDTMTIDLSVKYYPVPVGAVGLGLAALLNLWHRHLNKDTEND
ncbi:MAG: TRAP transporter small permease [Proteobacteria bacterium]|nr:TRAP transporter small permease [Pseudomonadota bacterium]